jgi:riboflavin synthase
MFTGIVEELGTVAAVGEKANLATLSLNAGKVARGIKLGESVAIDGVCLTVSKVKGAVLSFDIMKETLDKTTLGHLKAGGKVNLERAMTSGGRFGGHFVTGHVDGIGKITHILCDTNYIEFQIAVPASLKKFIVTKGSICVNGISLTVGAVHKNTFSVYMIPFTMQMTTMADKKVGDPVNVEVDILARYVLGQKK